MDYGINGKRALITGGSHGIGLCCALALADEGCDIAICSRTKDRIKNAVTQIRKKGTEVIGIEADVLSVPDIENVMKTVKEKWGGADILINNVGGGGRWGDEDVLKTKEQVWTDVYGKNALAAVRFTMLALPHMKSNKWGRVVTISSVYGREGGGRPWYNMAKSAEISLMKSLSLDKDLVRKGITFNSIASGTLMIPDTGWDEERKKDPEAFKKLCNCQFPMGRPGTPEEIGSVVAFICSVKASLLNGASIPVDGSEGRSY
ncbi:MAG: SDR family oxidoreductase, partial [Candidatus Margulisiibacteriota bacterium]